MRYISFFIFFLLSFFTAFATKSNTNFLVITDIHLNPSTNHVMAISPTKGSIANDLDLHTFQTLIEDIKKNINNGVVSKPIFIIILGDIARHHHFFVNDIATSEASEAIVFSTLKKTFPTIPIFYVFGNNDSLQKNYGPFSIKDPTISYKSPYNIAMLKGEWKDGFLSSGKTCQSNKKNSPCIITEDTTNGYYSAYLQPKLRLIALNSVLFSPSRKLVSDQDAINELRWLTIQLNIAAKKHESVLLAMHIPPGNNMYDHSAFWLPEEQRIFLNLVNAYSDNIIGLLAAHTHMEELKIIENRSGKIINGIYYTAALSTSHGNEPSIKTFYLSENNQRWQLTNYKAFHFSKVDNHIVFSNLYNYKNYYCQYNDSMLFACLHDITSKKMNKYYSAGNQNFSGIMNFPNDFILTINR